MNQNQIHNLIDYSFSLVINDNSLLEPYANLLTILLNYVHFSRLSLQMCGLHKERLTGFVRINRFSNEFHSVEQFLKS